MLRLLELCSFVEELHAVTEHSIHQPRKFSRHGFDRYWWPQPCRIRLPKIGWVRHRNSRELLGEVSNVIVSGSCGKWFVSLSTLQEVAVPQHPSTSTIGLDWGVANFMRASDGLAVNPCQPLQQFCPKLAKLQRRLARKKKFGKNWK
jgi:putative transposase